MSFSPTNPRIQGFDVPMRIFVRASKKENINTEEMFKLVLDYLKAENRICTAADLYHNFADESVGSVVLGCEWMVRQGWLERMGVPLQLTPNSSSTVEEIAYLYDFLEEDLF